MNAQVAPADGRALPVLSPAVAAAQERLWELRRALRSDRPAAADRWSPPAGDGDRPVAGSNRPPGADSPAQPAALPAVWAEIARRGLHSQTLAGHLRAAARRRAQSPDCQSPDCHSPDCHAPLATRPLAQSPARPLAPASRPVKVYPDLALAILRAKRAAPGRVWLLLRHADDAGRGAIAEREAARLLTGSGSTGDGSTGSGSTGANPLRICQRRQLANLLAAGDGLFWERRSGVIWLRSAVRVAAALGVARLGGSPVAVPLDALTGPIGRVRAHLYASFHSGRQRVDLLSGRQRPRGPIARATLTALSAASPNSQRAYERRAGVGRRSAVAAGPPAAAVDGHEFAWQRGRALFHLRDTAGRFGRPGAVYLAWQLPNEYTGPHATLPRGRQKRLNRALADLFLDGMTGNGERDAGRVAAVERRVTGGRCAPAAGERAFYASPRSALLARHDRERYWRGRGGVWHWQPETAAAAAGDN